MAKIYMNIRLIVLVTIWKNISGQECYFDPCPCCVVPNTRCENHKQYSDYIVIEYCLDGCMDGRWGERCADNCPDFCATCTRDSGNKGYPCASCIAKKYGSDDCTSNCPSNCATCTSSTSCQTCVNGYYNKYKYGTSGEYTNICKHSCSTRSHCKACTGYNSCNQCDDGYYGQDCQNDCSSGCQPETCIKTSGNCDCKTGFSGIKCDQCIAGRYYDDCNIDCLSQNCNNNTCVRDSGRCLSCKTGYYGNSLCDKVCSTSCKYDACDLTAGTCTHGCIPGYSGDKCCLNNNNCETCASNTQCSVCKTGYSGDKCCVNNDKCMTCTPASTCSQCKPGYSGDKCCLPNTFCKTCSSITKCYKCIVGRYGTTCTEICPNNCAETFCRNDGSCNSCKSGFYGSKCENECLQNCNECNAIGECIKCINGYYGISCDKCLDNCARCNSKTTCDLCVESYFGNSCTSCPINCVSCASLSVCVTCDKGYHGVKCQTECSYCKEGTECRQSDGYCMEACRDGKYGKYCNNDCDNDCAACQREHGSRCAICANGTFGEHNSKTYYHCSKKCSSACLNKRCNGSTGHCFKCLEGYRGDLCVCPVNCETCDENGQCQSCVAGYNNTIANCNECIRNKYGPECQIKCNDNCLNNLENSNCDKNGTCVIGCKIGYYGDKCDLRCDQNCKRFICSRSHGVCTLGCQDGFRLFGYGCVLDDTKGVPVAIFVGAVGSAGIIIAVIVFLLIKRRSNHRPQCCSVATAEVTQSPEETGHVDVTPIDKGNRIPEVINYVPGNRRPEVTNYTDGSDEYFKLDNIVRNAPVVMENVEESTTDGYEIPIQHHHETVEYAHDPLTQQRNDHGKYDELIVPEYEDTEI